MLSATSRKLATFDCVCHADAPIDFVCIIFPLAFWMLFSVQTPRIQGIEIIDNELPATVDRYTLAGTAFMIIIYHLKTMQFAAAGICLSASQPYKRVTRAPGLISHLNRAARVRSCLFIRMHSAYFDKNRCVPLHSLHFFEYAPAKRIIYFVIIHFAWCTFARSADRSGIVVVVAFN